MILSIYDLGRLNSLMNTIRMTARQFSQLREYLLRDERESAVFLLAGFFKNSNGIHFAIRELMIPQEDEYNHRSNLHIEVSPIFFNRAISKAEGNGITLIQCHSHPFASDSVKYSDSDDSGESLSAQTIYDCLNHKPMGSLLFGKKIVIGRAWLSPDSDPQAIDQIRIIDRHIRFQSISNRTASKRKVEEEIYDRQIKAFGKKGQEFLSSLKIGIVGAGGTGSCIAEQLAREGVRDFIIVDHDHFDRSNKTRMYGSTASNKQKEFKVNIVKKNIKRIEPKANVLAIPKNVINQKVLLELKDCDIVFSCTDRHAPRGVLNELAHQYYIPVIDVGVGLETKNDRIEGGTLRATLVSPSLPCLFCSSIINADRITAEGLGKEERELRQKAGYITGFDENAPSVIVFTTMAASLGLMLFKDLLFELLNSDANTLTINVTTYQSSRLTASVRNDCVCVLRLGKADFIPLSAPT
jgi:predicted dinucleotide-binding enzyme